MSLISVFFILFFYISALIFILGVSYKLVQYWNTPAPLKIPIAPSALDTKGVILKFIREIFLFSSLSPWFLLPGTGQGQTLAGIFILLGNIILGNIIIRIILLIIKRIISDSLLQ